MNLCWKGYRNRMRIVRTPTEKNQKHKPSTHAQFDLGRRRALSRVAPDDVDALELDDTREGHEQDQLRIVVVAVQARLWLFPLRW